MRTTKNQSNGSAEKTVKAIRREQINQNLYYRWSKEFLEAGKERLAGDTHSARRRPMKSRPCAPRRCS